MFEERVVRMALIRISFAGGERCINFYKLIFFCIFEMISLKFEDLLASTSKSHPK